MSKGAPITDEGSEQFEAAYWPIAATIHWIAFRDPAKLHNGALVAFGDPAHASADSLRLDIIAGLREDTLSERRPARALLVKLKGGGLVAYENGEPLPRDVWATTSESVSRLIRLAPTRGSGAKMS